MTIHQPNKRDKRSEKRLRLATHRLRAFLWPWEGETEPMLGFGFISEFSKNGAGLYLQGELAPGTVARLAFESESGPTYRAHVMWSTRFSLKQNFFGHRALSHRVGVRFQFVSEAERQRYLKYFDELKGRVLALDGTMKF